MRLPLLLALVLLAGCAGARQTVDPREPGGVAEMNARLAGRPAAVYLLDGTRIYARDVEVRADSTFWEEVPAGARTGIPTRQVHAVEAPVFRGALLERRGFVIGFVATLVGLAVVDGLGQERGRIALGRAAAGVGLAVLGGFAGSAVEARQQPAGQERGRFILNRRE